ncbi:MAG: glycosyltransferase family 4 protein [Gammaproteobacteria bacterium]
MKKKILHFIDSESYRKEGGIESVVRNITENYRNDLYKHRVCCRDSFVSKKVLNYKFPDAIKLKKILNEEKPYLVHFHGSGPNIWISITLLLHKNIPIFLSPSYHPPWTTKRPIMAYINKLFLNLVMNQDIYIAFSTKYEVNQFRLEKKNFIIMPPFFMNSKISKKKLNQVLFVGRDDNHKGLDVYIMIAKEFPTINFIAVTKPKRKYQVSNNLSFLSNISNKEIEELYADSKLLILPSSYESFGGVVFEALSKDCMVIISDRVKCIEYLENNKNVFLFKFKNKSQNIQSIKTIMKKLKKSDRSFLSDSDHNNSKNIITLEENISNLDKLYSFLKAK